MERRRYGSAQYSLKKVLSRHLKPEEMDVWRRYHKRGCSHYTRCKINQVNLDLNTTMEHRFEILKLAVDCTLKDEKFITEAVRDRRRIDFVNMTKDKEYEIETNPRVRKLGAETIYAKRRKKCKRK
jgi:hypothetical protein